MNHKKELLRGLWVSHFLASKAPGMDSEDSMPSSCTVPLQDL